MNRLFRFLIISILVIVFHLNDSSLFVQLLNANAMTMLIMARDEDVKNMKKRFSSKKKKTSKKRTKQAKNVIPSNIFYVIQAFLMGMIATFVVVFAILNNW